MGWTAAAIGGSALLNYFGGQQASNAATAQAQATLQAQQQWQTLSDPFSASGARSTFQQTYTPQLEAAMANPTSLLSNPAYTGMVQQGQQAVTRNMNATGNLNSGAELAGLSQYTDSKANAFEQQQIQQLQSLSGQTTQAQTTTPTSQITAQGAGQLAMQPYSAIGSGLTSLAAIYNQEVPWYQQTH